MANEILVRSSQEMKRLRKAASSALRALREMERAASPDVVGRYHLPAGEPLSMGEALAFIGLCREQCGGQDMSIIVIAEKAETGDTDE